MNILLYILPGKELKRENSFLSKFFTTKGMLF